MTSFLSEYDVGKEGPSLYGGGTGCDIDYLKKKNPQPRVFAGTKFNEGPHTYEVLEDYGYRTLNGSCTGILDDFFPKKDSMQMAISMGSHTREKKYKGMTNEEIVQLWKEIGEHASHHGTIMHQQIELFMNNAWDPTHEAWSSEENKVSLKYFLDFHRDEIVGKIVPLWTELIMSWTRYDFSGQDDFVGQRVEWLDDPVKKYWVIVADWKRSKKNFTEPSYGYGLGPCSDMEDTPWSRYTLQTTLYSLCLMENTKYIVKEIYVGVFHPNHEGYIWKQVTPVYEKAKEMLEIRRRQRASLYSQTLLDRTNQICAFIDALDQSAGDGSLSEVKVISDELKGAARSFCGLVADVTKKRTRSGCNAESLAIDDDASSVDQLPSRVIQKKVSKKRSRTNDVGAGTIPWCYTEWPKKTRGEDEKAIDRKEGEGRGVLGRTEEKVAQ